MSNNISIQINEINRLMNYDRSKTIIEQEVEVGKPMVIQNDSIIKLPKNWYNYSGEQFDYPNYCKYPDIALPGTPEKPVLRDYCIYRGPGNTKTYFRKDTKLDTINGTDEVIDMYRKIENKGLLKNLDDSQKNEVFSDMKKIFTQGSVKSFIVGDDTYFSSIAKTFGPQGPWTHKGWFSNGRGYTPPKFEYVTDGWSEYYVGLKDEISKIDDLIDELSSFLCGDDSPAAGLFEIPWIEYKSEELLCDVLAGLLMTIGGPFGVVGGLGIEILHANDLKNKGDDAGAIISLLIGMLPIFGDVGAKVIQKLLSKGGGKLLVTNVVKFINLLIKFNTGQVKASQVVKSLLNLSKEERQVLHWLWSTSRELSGKAKRLSSEFDKLKPMVDDLPDGINLDKKSIEKISEILENDKIFIELGNFAAQFASMMTMIVGGHTISELGFTDDNTFESQEEILEYYKNNPQAILDL